MTSNLAHRTVRDRLWLWGHPAGAHNKLYAAGTSQMGPVDGARALGIPNLIMVRIEGKPEPPFEQHADEFRSLDRLVWSVVGASGETSPEEPAAAARLARVLPNVTGFILDDFIKADGSGALSPAQLDGVRTVMNSVGRPLDLMIVVYAHQLHLPIAESVARCDVVAFWTWKEEELADLENNFATCERLAAGKRILLGLYMFDFGNNRPLPVAVMERQAELALGWLRAGRIEGIILLANTLVDLPLPAVEWTRHWIERIGDQPCR
jgi:hypothetical protein